METLPKRIVDILQQNQSEWKTNKDQLLQELQICEELDILQDILDIHIKVQKDSSLRGSENKPNSLLAYCLGITTKKPTGPFHNKKRRTYGRDGFPDIDMDFDHERRHEVTDFIVNKYGRDRVGNVGVVGKLQSKAALRRTIKSLDPEHLIDYTAKQLDSSANFALQNEILGQLPKSSPMRTHSGTIIENLQQAYEKISTFATYMDKYPEVFETAKRMEGNIAAWGCLAKDTPIKVQSGWIRIDQLNSLTKIAYIDKFGKIEYTNKFHSHKTGHKKCYKMTLSNGSFIKVTDEHLIFTNKGCVEFKKIRKNLERYRIYYVKT